MLDKAADPPTWDTALTHAGMTVLVVPAARWAFRVHGSRSMHPTVARALRETTGSCPVPPTGPSVMPRTTDKPASTHGPPSLESAHPTVLLVEDYPETRAIFRLVLESAGFEVLEAENAEDGLDTAAHERPDVILTDLVMPGMSGVEAARILRRNDDTGDIPIVAATGSVSARALSHDVRRWFVEVLEKPVQPGELVRAVRDALEGGSHEPSWIG